METKTAQRAPKSVCNFTPAVEANVCGMNDRIKRLRKESFEAEPSLSIERALIETEFYKENYGKYPIPILRALNFYEICKKKTIYIGKDELIVQIHLGRNATFKFINIYTWNGKITVKVPKNYDGRYDVKLNQGAKLVKCPRTDRTMKSVIKVEAYQDTIIEK